MQPLLSNYISSQSFDGAKQRPYPKSSFVVQTGRDAVISRYFRDGFHEGRYFNWKASKFHQKADWKQDLGNEEKSWSPTHVAAPASGSNWTAFVFIGEELIKVRNSLSKTIINFGIVVGRRYRCSCNFWYYAWCRELAGFARNGGWCGNSAFDRLNFEIKWLIMSFNMK